MNGVKKLKLHELRSIIRQEIRESKRVRLTETATSAKDELIRLMDAIELAGSLAEAEQHYASLEQRCNRPDLDQYDLSLFLQYVEDGMRLTHETNDDDSYEGRADPSQFFSDALDELEQVIG